MSKPLNIPFAVASAALVGIAAIHAFMGGPEINVPVQLSDLHPVVRSVMAVIWHAITVLALIMAGSMAWSARHANTPLVLSVLAVNLGFIAVFLAVGIGQLGNILQMPQWVLFLAVSALIGWGLMRQTAQG